ncbi:hypothetical protein HMPREF1986_02365 [Oribacterium sp. oral taxon 078 str. F0263]|nr:hypothetical protein HMPREF1986_02365 [Oribacterium sp. oral taxon 078 str. F0263]
MKEPFSNPFCILGKGHNTIFFCHDSIKRSVLQAVKALSDRRFCAFLKWSQRWSSSIDSFILLCMMN